MLFACTKCHSRHPFEELSKEEQLCRTCRKKNPLTPCQYCQMEYHIMKKIDGSPVCTKCAQNISSYGVPKACKYCRILAAFKTSYCACCISSRKKYGEPVSCQQCKRKCAFNKSGDARDKVGGQVLCLKCTMAYKKQKHEQQRLLKMDGNSNDDKHSSKTKSSSGKLHITYQSHSVLSENLSSLTSTEKVIAPLKAENLAKTFKPRIGTIDVRSGNSSSSPFVSNSLNTSKLKTSPNENNDSKVEPSFGDHMSEMTKLRDEIAMLKKIISQKEKIILEKDKKINEFNAEKWDLEKLQRQKISVIQKDFETGLQKLRLENGELRKQVSTLKKKKAKFDEQTVKNAGKIRLEVFKPHSPALISSKSYLDGQSENTDSDSEFKSQAMGSNVQNFKENDSKKSDSKYMSLEKAEIDKDAKLNREKIEHCNENEEKLSCKRIDKDENSNLDGLLSPCVGKIEESCLTISDNKLHKRKRKIRIDGDQEDVDSSLSESEEKPVMKKMKSKSIDFIEDFEVVSVGEVPDEISSLVHDASGKGDFVNNDLIELVSKVDVEELVKSDVVNDFQMNTSVDVMANCANKNIDSKDLDNHLMDSSKSLESKNEPIFFDHLGVNSESDASSPQSCSGNDLLVDET